MVPAKFHWQRACGINDTSVHSNMKCRVCIRKDSYDNVVLSSGTTICQRMFEHMTNELTALAPSTMRSRWLLRFGMDWIIYLVYYSGKNDYLPVFCFEGLITEFVCSRTETSSLSALNGSITWKCCYSQISLVREPANSLTLHSRTS